MVSRSRISPTSTMSGSSRSAARRPFLKLSVWVWTSRWFTRHFLRGCTNSMGSSMVRMWSLRVRLAMSMMAASVVDLPLPVGPVTSTRPLDRLARRRIGSGRPRRSGSGISLGMTRQTKPGPTRSLKKFTRKRQLPSAKA